MATSESGRRSATMIQQTFALVKPPFVAVNTQVKTRSLVWLQLLIITPFNALHIRVGTEMVFCFDSLLPWPRLKLAKRFVASQSARNHFCNFKWFSSLVDCCWFWRFHNQSSETWNHRRVHRADGSQRSHFAHRHQFIEFAGVVKRWWNHQSVESHKCWKDSQVIWWLRHCEWIFSSKSFLHSNISSQWSLPCLSKKRLKYSCLRHSNVGNKVQIVQHRAHRKAVSVQLLMLRPVDRRWFNKWRN